MRKRSKIGKLGRIGWLCGWLCLFNGCSALRRAIQSAIGLDPAPPIDPQTFIMAKTWWLIPGAILAAAGAGLLLFLGKVKAGIALGIACGIVLFLSVTVFAHFVLIGWLGLGIAVLAMVYGVYLAYIHRKAMLQLVMTTEATKPELTELSRSILFGNGGDGDKGLVGTIQSPATEKLVKQERQKIEQRKHESPVE